MKTYTVIFLTAILGFSASCSKDKDEKAGTLPGFWVGKYGGGSETPANGYSFLFREDGTVRVFDGSDTATASKAEGTYVKAGEVVTTSYRYVGSSNVYLTSSALNGAVSHQAGSWGSSPSSTDGGTFYLDKQ